MASTQGAEVRVDFTAQGGDSVARAVTQLVQEIRRLGQTEKQVAADTHDLGAALEGALANFGTRVAGFLVVAQGVELLAGAMRGAVGEGLRLNGVIETQELGIATLISAQTTLTDATGRQLKGQEALNAAYGVAQKQLKQLQIAGLATAAPTEQLVEAYQTAIGSGISAGLNLDEIREITIGITQAAGALGVPYNQLNQEVRSILDGHINVNSRIATAIGLTNEQIRQAKQQGRLAEFLNEQFAAFGVAGERTRNTFQYMIEDWRESLSFFAAESTRPLFDKLAAQGRSALDGVYDLDTLEFSDRLKPLVSLAQDIFDRIGDLAGGAMQRAVSGAEELGDWLEQNREEIDRIVASGWDVVSAIGEISAEMAKVVGATVQWAVESGTAEETFQAIADTIRWIKDNPIVSGSILAGGGVALAVAQPWLVAGAAVSALVVEVHRLATAEQDARVRAREAAVEYAKQTGEVQRLAERRDALARTIASEATSAHDSERAKKELKKVEEELVKLNPAYQDAIEQARLKHISLTEALWAEVEARDALVYQARQQAQERARAAQGAFVQFQQANPKAREADADLQAYDKFGLPMGNPAAIAAGQQLRRLRREMDEANKDLVAANAAAEAVRQRLHRDADGALATIYGDGGGNGVRVVPKDKPGDAGDGKKALAALKAANAEALATLKAALEEQQRELDERLAQNLVSYRDYYAQLTALQQAGVDAEIAAKRRELSATKEPAQRTSLRADLVKLEAERARIADANAKKRTDAEAKIGEKITEIQARILEAEGRTAEARALQLEKEFGELIQRLLVEGDTAGAELVRRLINVEQARASLAEIERGIDSAQGVQSRRIAQIRAEQDAGLRTERDAQRAIAEAYRETAAAIEEVLPRMQALAAASGDPRMAEQVARLRGELDQLHLSIRTATDDWLRMGVTARRSLEDGLARFFSEGLSTAFAPGRREYEDGMRRIQEQASAIDRALEQQGLGAQERMNAVSDYTRRASAELEHLQTTADAVKSAFRDMAVGVVEALQRIVAEMIAAAMMKKLIDATTGGLGGLIFGTGTGALGTGFATGGYVSGPGTATSDSIPARLSHGEFVQPAASVSYYGAGAMEALRQRRIPRELFANIALGARRPVMHAGVVPRFAQGGLVETAPRAAASPAPPAALDGRLTVGLEEGLVLRELSTTAGQRLVVEVATKNRRALRRALGL